MQGRSETGAFVQLNKYYLSSMARFKKRPNDKWLFDKEQQKYLDVFELSPYELKMIEIDMGSTEVRDYLNDAYISRTEAHEHAQAYQQTPQRNETPMTQAPSRLILPTRFSTADLDDEVLVDLYNRSRAQSTGDKTFHHPGEDQLPATMDTRFLTSNIVAELLANKLRAQYPKAMGEVRGRTLEELNRHSDGGTDIIGLPDGKIIDVKYVAAAKPSNVTARVGRNLEQALAEGKDSLLSFYQLKGGYISNEDVATVDHLMNKLHHRPQAMELRGHLKASDFINASLRGNLDKMREPQYYVPHDTPHKDNDLLIDYLMQT